MIELLLQAERALEMGRVDAAETLYKQVAEADPRNSIAVVGLARVALERGDEPGALALARSALAIDPENAAAGRMVARLEEVLAYRSAAPAPERPDPPADPQPTIRPDPAPTAQPPTTMRTSGPPEPTRPDEPPAAEPATDGQQKGRSWLDRLSGRDR